MKNAIIIISAILLFSSCSKEGEIIEQSGKNFIINGKKYKFYKVVPADGEIGVWLLIPMDSSKIPVTTKYQYNTGGKYNHTVEVNAIQIP